MVPLLHLGFLSFIWEYKGFFSALFFLQVLDPS
jgi:hypothetical protein